MTHIPSHVPADLVRSFDYFSDPELPHDPWARVTEVAATHPPIFWSTAHEGHWVVARHKYILDIMNNPHDFANNPSSLGPNRFPVRLIPTEMDPPEHAKYRRVLAEFFSQKSASAMRASIRTAADQIVEGVRPAGSCNFVAEVAQRFPTFIFADLMGVPRSEVPMYLKWVHNYLHNADADAARDAGAEIVDHLRGILEQRKSSPGDDLITILLNAKIDGVPMNADDVVNYALLVFTGGLDTLIAVMGYSFHYLATHPPLRRQLIEQPKLIAPAAVEMFRRFSVVSRTRRATRDLEFEGIRMREGDRLLVMNSFASLDPEVFADPLRIDPTRAPKPHAAFSFGPHRCLGAPLSQVELEEILKAWLERIPDFEIAPGSEYYHFTGIFGLSSLHLRW